MKEANPDTPSTKKHFNALDGPRGIAAVGVVLFHFMEIAAPDYRDNFIPLLPGRRFFLLFVGICHRLCL